MKSTILIILILILTMSSYSQNQKPVVVGDTASIMAEININVNVLRNDYDPDGDSIKLCSFSFAKHGNCWKLTDSTLKYVSNYYTGLDSVYYKVEDNAGNISDKAYLVINVLNNPSLPYASNDVGSTISCDSLLLYVIQNDHDPNGDPLMIDTYPMHALYDQVLKKINDSVLLYRSNPDFIGTDTITYRARQTKPPFFYSNHAKAIIHVGANPAIPKAVNDIVDYLSFSTKHIIPLQNDTIPTSDSMEIIFQPSQPSYITLQNDQSVEYFDSVSNNENQVFIPYYIRRKDDNAYYSNIASIVIQYSHDPQFFYAKDDTLSVDAWGVIVHDLVVNDHNPNPLNPLKILKGFQGFLSDSVRYTDRLMTYYPGNREEGKDSLIYVITDGVDPVKRSVGKVVINVKNKISEYLDINNVRALFHADGLHFFKEHAEYEVPRGSGKTSLFANSLWIGGMDESGSLHFAGEQYRQGPNHLAAWMYPDYYSGPVMDSAAYGYEQDRTWSDIWKLNRTDIEYHCVHFNDQGYQPIQDILTWPGNGNVSLGQEAKLAPYVDYNADGTYNPFDGDYPAIRGDQALFFIFNDDRNYHNESQGEKLKVEIQGLAYAFDLPNDTAFKNTVFLHYTVINRSNETYTGTYFGIFTDIDLGYDNDDYIGCDVERNMYFGYNGDSIDGTGQDEAYGAHPPVQAVIILAGPKIDDDGIDNPKYDNLGNQLCDESVNGVFFGDTIVDNERFGMQRFVYFNISSGLFPMYNQGPRVAPDYYNLMMGIWNDSTQMIYGGNGHASTGYGPACDFMFPGNSDSLNWGVGCTPPNGPVNWTEKTALSNPSDRRGVSSTGPITFKPGDKQEIDIAFSWACDYESSDPDASLIKLRGVVDSINMAFAKNKLPDGSPIYGIPEHAGNNNIEFKIYPNPARDFINLELIGNQNETYSIRISSLRGEMIRQLSVQAQKTVEISVSDLSNGVYIIQCQSKSNIGTGKFIVIK